MSTNLIVKNVFAQIDKEENRHVLMDKKTEHWFDEAAVNSQDAFLTTYSGTKQRRQTTQGVSLCIKWRNSNTSCVSLKEIKEAYPDQLAYYVISAKISVEPAFSWWVPHNLKKRNRIICKIEIQLLAEDSQVWDKGP